MGTIIDSSDIVGSLEVDSTARDLVSWSLIEKQITRLLADQGVGHLTISPRFVSRSIPAEAETCELLGNERR